jgi:hypothetical protein
MRKSIYLIISSTICVVTYMLTLEPVFIQGTFAFVIAAYFVED